MRATRPSGLCKQQQAPCYACCKLRVPSTHTHIHRTNDARPTICVCSMESKKLVVVALPIVLIVWATIFPSNLTVLGVRAIVLGIGLGG